MKKRTLALALSAALLSAQMGNSQAVAGVTYTDLLRIERLIIAGDMEGLRQAIQDNPAILEIDVLGSELLFLLNPQPNGFLAALGIQWIPAASSSDWQELLALVGETKVDYEGIY